MSAKRMTILLSGACLAVVLVSCQQVFTFSPLKAFDRNPANMTPQQQVNYAEEALKSGDPATMKAAYDAIKNSTDPNVQLVAGQLAFGASGASAALTQALADVASGASLSTVQSVLQNVDTSLAVSGAQNIVNAANGGASVSDSEYAIAAAAYVVSAAQAAGGFDKLANLTSGPGSSDLAQAKTLVGDIQTTNSSLATTIQSFY